MLKYLTQSRKGQFLIVGTILMLIGFIIGFFNPVISRGAFYLSIFFLGYFAAKEAAVSTIEEKALNVDLLMVLAAIGAMLIGFESEGAVLLFIFALSENLEDYAYGKSTASIEELMSQVPLTAQKLTSSGEVVKVATEDLVLGDIVVVSKGDQIPIDGKIDRQGQVNEAALTGESLPVTREAGEEVFAGTINEGNAFHLKVSKLANETVFSNIIRMVEEAQGRPSRVSSTIDKIESKYVIGVLIAVPIFIGLLYFVADLSFQESFYRGMVFLTVASPCALVASATPATLSAISNGARNGILTKGGAAFEALSNMTHLFTDKTGTLTYGEFSVVDYQVSDDILAEVVYMEQQSNHPIADAIVSHFSETSFDSVDKTESVKEIAGKGLAKGDMMVGKPSAFENYKDPYNIRQYQSTEHTSVFVGHNQEIVGYFTLADEVRPTAKIAVDGFKEDQVDVEILSGDSPDTTAHVANELGIDRYFGGLLPEDKIKFIEKAAAEDNSMIGMIGDGINDAPALATADIGIAMGSGSSVAMESSDIVIVKNDLAKLFDAFKLSHKLGRIIKQNIVFAVGVIITLVILNFFGLISLPIAVVCHEGSTILVILNGLRLLKQDQGIEELTEKMKAPVYLKKEA